MASSADHDGWGTTWVCTLQGDGNQAAEKQHGD